MSLDSGKTLQTQSKYSLLMPKHDHSQHPHLHRGSLNPRNLHDPRSPSSGRLSDYETSRFSSLNDYLRSTSDQVISYDGLDNVAWHVSAGLDFAPITTWAAGYLPGWKKKLNITSPSLHLFTDLCNDQHEEPLWDILQQEDPSKRVLWQNWNVRMTVQRYQLVRYGDTMPFDPQRHHADFVRGKTFASVGADGFYADVLIEDIQDGYQETTRLLYLFSENINTFHHFIANRWLTVRYLAASCEGLGMGGCKRSIFDHLKEQQYYEDNCCFAVEWFIVPDFWDQRSEEHSYEYTGFKNYVSLGAAAGGKGHVITTKSCYYGYPADSCFHNRPKYRYSC